MCRYLCIDVYRMSLIAASPPLECGVASAVFASNTATAVTAVETGKLSFWWNWNTETLTDLSRLEPAVRSTLTDTFVPMLWGTADPPSLDFLQDHEGDVMGFNEPDQYGPACCNCDGKQSYYPATSSGWAPLFNPVSASTAWQTILKDIMPANRTAGTGNSTVGSGKITRIVSPAMAGNATAEPGVDCSADPAVAGNSHFCAGWLGKFKTHALGLTCADLEGRQSNCWDVIDSIQIHAYAKTAKEVKDKINR